jgi:pilus assembly protein CpaD
MARLAPVLVVALLAAGCTPDVARWTPAESPKENKVDFVTMAHPVNFAPGAVTPTSVEVKSLSGFLDSVSFGYGDQVTLDAGPHSGNASADALAAKRIDAVMEALRHLRIRAQVASRPTVDGALARNAVIVTVGRYVATAPKCPDRTKPEADDYANNTESNFGCATATNLGLMVANPGDLIRGTPAGPADADFASHGIQLYREGGIAKTLAPSAIPVSGGGAQ